MTLPGEQSFLHYLARRLAVVASVPVGESINSPFMVIVGLGLFLAGEHLMKRHTESEIERAASAHNPVSEQ